MTARRLEFELLVKRTNKRITCTLRVYNINVGYMLHFCKVSELSSGLRRSHSSSVIMSVLTRFISTGALIQYFLYK